MVTSLEWQDATFVTEGGVRVTAWATPDGRFKIEQHPQAPDKFMLTDRGRFAGIHRRLAAAQYRAAERAAES